MIGKYYGWNDVRYELPVKSGQYVTTLYYPSSDVRKLGISTYDDEKKEWFITDNVKDNFVISWIDIELYVQQDILEKEKNCKVKGTLNAAKERAKQFNLISDEWIDSIEEDWDKSDMHELYYYNELGEIEILFYLKGTVEDKEILKEMREGCDSELHARRFFDKCLANSEESYYTESYGPVVYKNGF